MKTGLRTEIVVSICLLLGAALLFAGFLLLKLTEQELLAQKREQARSDLNLLVKLIETSKATPSQFLAAFDQLEEAGLPVVDDSEASSAFFDQDH